MTTYRVTHHWGREDEDGEKGHVVREYDVESPEEAALAYYRELDVSPYDWRRESIEVVRPGDPEEKPERRLRNYEKDPMAEVSDGYLSNIAVSFGNLRRRLEWEPKYCRRLQVRTTCPHGCGEMRRLDGKWGPFFKCFDCGETVGARTQKVADYQEVVGVCGEPLVASANQNGVPISVCPSCNPERAPSRSRR